jgi:3-oxoacyl-[acyl-carrier-protein] synthase III
VIEAIASYLPELIVSNEALAGTFANWTAEKIFQKTGIRERHIAAAGETVVDMAAHACRGLAESRDCGELAPDFILFCTQSPEQSLSSSACLLQHRLNLPASTGALDIASGCSGYLYGLAGAHGLLTTGVARRILFVTSETYSRLLHPEDAGCRTLFGDAATATLLTADSGHQLSAFAFGTDGAGQQHLTVPNAGDEGQWQFGPGCLHMDGPEVFAFTIAHVPETVHRVLTLAQIALEDVDYFVFHQANAFMLEHLRKKLGIPREKFILHLEHTGNTVSNTIPLALEHCISRNLFEPGMKIMLVGFGVGLSWGGCMLDWR